MGNLRPPEKDNEVPIVPEVRLTLGARFVYPPEGVLEVVGIDYVEKRAELERKPGVNPANLPVIDGEDDWVLVSTVDYMGGRMWQERDVNAINSKFLSWV